MLYMPASTLSMPLVLQETKTVPVTTTTTNYYMVPQTTIIPTLPLYHTTLAYPTYGILTKPIEKCPTLKVKDSIQHVIHHYSPSTVDNTCNCCDLCCPWKNESSRRQSRSSSQSSSRSCSPPVHDQQHYSRRAQYDGSKMNSNVETIDEKIARLRYELCLSSSFKHDKSTETIDYYHRPPSSRVTFEKYSIPYKQHYDAPKPRPRPRSTSAHRRPSLPREPWRPSNQNDYPWRDAHLPAYRAASLNRSTTPASLNNSFEETAHKKSHLNMQNQSKPIFNDNYIYRPKSEVEARKHYIQTTGKNPDHEVHQSLCPTTTIYNSTGSAYDTKQNHLFYSSITPKLVDLTPNSYSNNNNSCIHVVPKHGNTTLEPPYLKIYNAPVTYLH